MRKRRFYVSFVTVFLLFLSAFSAHAKVPSDAVKYKGHYYKRYDKIITWTKANAACKKAGGHLITIDSAGEQKLARILLKGGTRRSYWMGGRRGTNGDWYWISGYPFPGLNWGPGQPDWSGDYLQISNDPTEVGGIGFWDDTDVAGDRGGGMKDQGYICEWDSAKAGFGFLKKRTALKTTSLKKIIKKYKAVDQLTQAGTFRLPGLVNTHTEHFDCDAMTPQGICVTDDYILVSAYCGIKTWKKQLNNNVLNKFKNNRLLLEAEKDHKQHNSVLYVLDKHNGDLLRTIILPTKGHNGAGGIAFDGTNVWFAGSTNRCVYRVALDKLYNPMVNGQEKLNAFDYKSGKLDIDSVSFLTFFEGKLWIGRSENSPLSSGDLKVYEVTKKGTVKPAAQHSYKIPSNGNGVDLVRRENGDLYVIINSSPERFLRSKMHVFRLNEKDNSLKQIKAFKLPPMAEELCIDGGEWGKIYTIFESAAASYSTVQGWKANIVTDQMLIGWVSSLF